MLTSRRIGRLVLGVYAVEHALPQRDGGRSTTTRYDVVAFATKSRNRTVLASLDTLDRAQEYMDGYTLSLGLVTKG